MTEEEKIFLLLKCSIAYNYEKTKRFYWRDPNGDHKTNKILFIEHLINNKWIVVYEDTAVE